ncbi:putative S-adenosyl-L-methionine-dependent methyltransferase [Helianthus anomalus]
MRGRPNGSYKKRLLTTFVLVGAALLFLYFRSLRKLGSSYLSGDDESNLGSKQDEFKFGLDDEDGIVPKSFPGRLKLDLSLMEHHERNSPLPERRFNCLIPLPNGYKVRFYLIEVAKWTCWVPCHTCELWYLVKRVSLTRNVLLFNFLIYLYKYNKQYLNLNTKKFLAFVLWKDYIFGGAKNTRNLSCKCSDSSNVFFYTFRLMDHGMHC